MGVPWPLWPPLMPTTATVVMADTALATAMDTDMARGLLTPSPPLPLRPSLRLRLMLMPTTAMVDTALAMEVLATDTARGPLMPMPTTAMVDMAVMAVTALATAMDTAMARGPLMPMPTTAMVDMADMAVTALDTAMDTAMARGPLMPMPMPTTA